VLTPLDPNWFSALFSLVGLFGGLISWILNLKIKHDLMEHDEKTTKAIHEITLSLTNEIDALREKLTDKYERMDRDLTELKSSLSDRILTIVNGKYVRTDLHQQTVLSTQERFVTFKQLIEVSLDRIETGLDRQITDLKERILSKDGK
jgi:hypothetical protein